MSTKSALVIGISNYQDQKLARLCCPSSDVKALAAVLHDPGLGAFDSVESHVDEQRPIIERAITRLFNDKQHDDLVLLYFSGHGLRDDNGDLYLAARDTDPADLDGSAIAADFVKRVMNKSNSRRQLLILDCCHSGAFSAGFKGAKAETIGGTVGTRSAFDPDGFGRVILTASDATQYAWEGDTVIGEASNSLYTHFLIEGIRTGEADIGCDGMITVDELHEYVYRRTVATTGKQRPTKICDREQGTIILSRAPLHSAPLPQEMEAAIHNSLPSVRLAIVDELVTLFKTGNPGAALSAHTALVSLTSDDSSRVRSAALSALAACAQVRSDLPPALLHELTKAPVPAAEDPQHVEALRRSQAEEAEKRQKEAEATQRLKAEAETQQQLARQAQEQLRLAREADAQQKEKLAREAEEQTQRAQQSQAQLHAAQAAETQRRLGQEAEAQRRLAQAVPQRFIPSPAASPPARPSRRKLWYAIAAAAAVCFLIFGALVIGPFVNNTSSSSATNQQQTLAPITPRQSARDSAPEEDNLPDTEVPPAEKAPIARAISHWQQALLSNDPAAIAACYASTVQRYYLQQNVSRDWIYQSLQAEKNTGKLFRRADITGLSLSRRFYPDIQARFIEVLSHSTDPQDPGTTVRTFLLFTREDGQWKISAERQYLGATGPH